MLHPARSRERDITRRYRLIGAFVVLLLVLAGAAVSVRRLRDSHQPPPAAVERPVPPSYAPVPGLPSPPSPSVVERPVAATPATGDAVRRDRFGVALGGGDPRQVVDLGLRWYIPLFDKEPVAPPGTTVVRRLFFSERIDEQALRARVRHFPGSYWLIDNEPNVPEMGNSTPEAYADALHWYAGVIRDADPRATLVGPNVLNWDFICEGCRGYVQGKAWTEQMRAAYLSRYGTEPPFDIWSLHTYDVDWFNLPQGNYQRQIAQVQGMRTWLDAIPALRGKEIWLTEVGIVWGYPSVNWQDGIAEPIGDYDEPHVEAYLRGLIGWLDANAERLQIGRWFLWSVWQGPESWESVAGGINLTERPQPGAPPTRLGRLYRQLAGVP